MAQNWDAPPPPPPPPGPPPGNQQPQQYGGGYGRVASQPPQSYGQQPAAAYGGGYGRQQSSPVNSQGQYGGGYGQMQPQNAQALAPVDKNAAYIQSRRSKPQNKQKEKPKINLFGDGFLNKAKMAEQPKKRSKYVILPNTGLTEMQLFNKYRIESDKIGAGAFARVKIIRSKENGTQYALKMVKKKGKSSADIEAFKKEILYLSKLTNHPNIIKMYDFCDSEKGLYMVLEYCNGGDVMQQIEKIKSFTEDQTRIVAQQLVSGLCYFHKEKIVHRDLKLDNLMYNNNVLKIIDFGLAGDCNIGPLNTPCGTLHFTAPEVLQSFDYTTMADMWSVGVVVYMLLCGFPPFFDNTGNEQRLFQIIKKAKFQFVNAYFGDVSAECKNFISKLLVKKPSGRMTANDARQHPWLLKQKMTKAQLEEQTKKPEVIDLFAQSQIYKQKEKEKEMAKQKQYNANAQYQQYNAPGQQSYANPGAPGQQQYGGQQPAYGYNNNNQNGQYPGQYQKK